MLAEAVRPVGVEAVEDAFEIFRRDAGALVLDADHDEAGFAAAGDTHGAALGAEGQCVVDQVADHLTETRIEALHHHAVATWRAGVHLELHACAARGAGFVEESADGFEKGRDIHLRTIAARQLGIETRRVRDVGDETVDAAKHPPG